MNLTHRNIYYCKVVEIKPTYILIDFKNTRAICHISEVSDYLVNDINTYFKVGQCYHFLLLNPTTNDQKYRFSYKQIHPQFLRWHYSAIATISGFDNLHKMVLSMLD